MNQHGGRLHTLDAMRGLAALVVATFHFEHGYAPHGYLAVDFFFALSGLVIARSYSARLLAGETTARFVGLRVVRLYPLFFAGLLIGVAHALQGAARASTAHLDGWTIVGSTVLGLAMLPNPFQAQLYPLNGAFWSLGAELAVNILFAAVIVRTRTVALCGVVLVAAIALATLSGPPHFGDQGVDWVQFPMLVARTLFSFCLGVLFARWAVGDSRRTTLRALVPIAMLVLVMIVGNTPVTPQLYDLQRSSSCFLPCSTPARVGNRLW